MNNNLLYYLVTLLIIANQHFDIGLEKSHFFNDHRSELNILLDKCDPKGIFDLGEILVLGWGPIRPNRKLAIFLLESAERNNFLWATLKIGGCVDSRSLRDLKNGRKGDPKEISKSLFYYLKAKYLIENELHNSSSPLIKDMVSCWIKTAKDQISIEEIKKAEEEFEEWKKKK